MFIAVRKNRVEEVKEVREPFMDSCVLAVSKGQIRRRMEQIGMNYADLVVIELKDI